MRKKYPNNIPILTEFKCIHVKKYALHAHKSRVYKADWIFGSNLVLSAKREKRKQRQVHLNAVFSFSFCKAPPQAERDVGARATKSRRGRLSMITWMSFQLCDKFELCDAVNLLTLWFRQSIGDYVVPDWHTEF